MHTRQARQAAQDPSTIFRTPPWQRGALAGAVALSLWAGGVQAAVGFTSAGETFLVGTGVGDRLLVGDFDGDGIPDLATTPDLMAPEAYPKVDGVNVLLMDGLGGVKSAGDLLGGEYLTGMTAADFNKDGKLDLATSEGFGSLGAPVGLCQSVAPRVPVLTGNGANVFTLQGCLTVGERPGGVASGDFNGDGNPDLAVVNSSRYSSGAVSRNAHILLGQGNGDFTAQAPFLADHGDDVITTDFNGDAKLDLAIAGESGVQLYRGNGDGSFALHLTLPGMHAFRLAAGDLNGDGVPDFAAVGSLPTDAADDLVWISLSQSGGSFASLSLKTGANPLIEAHPTGVAIADLNRDGFGDVVVINNQANEVAWFLADGKGGFLPRDAAPVGDHPKALALVDLNSDGLLDIVTANLNLNAKGEPQDGTLSLLLQNPVPEPASWLLSLVGLGLVGMRLAGGRTGRQRAAYFAG